MKQKLPKQSAKDVTTNKRLFRFIHDETKTSAAQFHTLIHELKTGESDCFDTIENRYAENKNDQNNDNHQPTSNSRPNVKRRGVVKSDDDENM